jgi:D-amino acid aminotransferase
VLEAWVDGGLVPADEARVSVFDRGFRTGEGVFETFRVYGDHVFRLDAHLARAFEGARVIGFDVGRAADVREACITTARANAARLGGDDSVLRLTLTPGTLDPEAPFPGRPDTGPTVVVTSQRLAVPATLHRDGIAVATVAGGRALPQVKALSYLTATVARQRAADRGAQEALLVDAHTGEVLEGAASNVFAVLDGRLVTPPRDAGLLAGVTRSVVLEVAARLDLEVTEAPLPLDDLHAAAEVLLTATTREVVPVVRVDDTTVGDGRPGPVTHRLHAAFRDEVARERREQPQGAR